MRALLFLAAIATPHIALADETRPYQIDVVGSWRSGEVSGWNMRLFAGYVPWTNLAPSRTDRAAYVGVGLHAAWGQLHVDRMGTSWLDTFSLGPTLRAGFAWGDRPGQLSRHGYVSITPLWSYVVPDPMLRDRGNHPGVRVAMGLSAPSWRPWVVRNAAKLLDPPKSDFGSASGSMGTFLYIPQFLGFVGSLLVPDTVEVAYERAAGVERISVGLGYSL